MKKILFISILCSAVIIFSACERKSGRLTNTPTENHALINSQQFSVNYVTIKKNVLAGHYSYVVEGINDDYFQVPVELMGSRTQVEGKLFAGPYNNQIELERDFAESGYRHSSLTELLAYRIANPDSTEYMICSVGSFYVDIERNLYPATLRDSIVYVALDFSKYDPRARFLGIKK